MAEKLFAIDAFCHIYQFYYAIKGLTGPDGEPVNAVYGFARMLQKLETEYSPDYLVVAFDGPGKPERAEVFEDYKANRKPMPEALERQIPLIEELLEVHNVPRLSAENQEADDVLATLATRAAEHGLHTVIVTTDKDAEQLISERVSVLHLHKDRQEMLDPEALEQKKGVRPDQVVEAMALSGDTSDNIPGVPGIGPKTAFDLIRRYGSVDGVYEHLEEISGPKTRERLAEHRDDVRLARELVTLDRDVALQIEWGECRLGGARPEQIRRFYRALGFHSLIEQDPDPAPTAAQASLFPAASEPLADREALAKDYRAVTELDDLRSVAREMSHQQLIAVDLETTSLQPRKAHIVGFAFSWAPDQAVYVPVRAPGGGHCSEQQALAVLRPLLEGASPAKTGQNLKYDIAVLKGVGIELGGLAGDAMVASYLLSPADRSHGLDALARRHLNYDTVKIDTLIGSGADQTTMDRVPIERVTPYACEDADVALQLSERLTRELREEDLHELFTELELPLIPVLAAMEWRGIRVDTDHLRTMSEQFERQLTSLEQSIWQEAGKEFNVNSPQQLSAVMFEDMGLPVPRGRRTQTGYSTASDVLEGLKGEHRVAELVLQYRELSKLKSTYADALLQMVNPDTGRVHCSFNQTVTATGRLSSSDPNLQNIPVRTPLGRRIRAAFVPGEQDMSLLSADYSQVELRIVAHCSGDPALRRAFAEDRDIHCFVAAQVHGVPEDEVTPAMRQQAKAVNFGIIYGQTPYGLSRALGIPTGEAEQFIAGYFERYPKVREFIGQTIDRARQFGYVKTLAGRKRRIEGIRSRGASRSAAERIAVNTVIQGSAADLIKRAMIRIHRELPQVSPRAAMLLQIHDELVFEVPDAKLETVREFVAASMTEALKIDVPLKVDTADGKNWAETK